MFVVFSKIILFHSGSKDIKILNAVSNMNIIHDSKQVDFVTTFMALRFNK
jgi:hypothetical protein